MSNTEFRALLERMIENHVKLRDNYLEAQTRGLSFEWDSGKTMQDRINQEDSAVLNLQAALNKVPHD